MRIAIITDVHGNKYALEAALEDIEHQSVDQIVFAGDTINGAPHSRECWDMAHSLQAVILQGNNEHFIGNFKALQTQDPVLSSERFKSSRWCVSQFSTLELEKMASLPITVQFPDLLVTHATPRDVYENLTADTTAEELREKFAGWSENFIARGHNHKWLEHHVDGRTITTVNACGGHDGGATYSQYAIFTKTKIWTVEKRILPYDFESLLADMMHEEYLTGSGPLVRIYRHELITGQEHWMPFLRKYVSMVDAETLTLEAAVNQYLELES